MAPQHKMVVLEVVVMEVVEERVAEKGEEQEEAKGVVARTAVKKANLHCSSEIPPSVLKTGYICMGTSW